MQPETDKLTLDAKLSNDGIIYIKASGKVTNQHLEQFSHWTDSVKSLTASINNCFERAANESTEFKEVWIQNAYGYLRSLCEVIVEQELLAGATRRFEPNVRMGSLTKIKGGLLEAAFAVIVPVFDDCCRYTGAHSQPLETLNVRPSLTRAKEDFQKVLDARAAYGKAVA